MKRPAIGCIAWGSLLWDPRTLPLAGPFVHAGPMLPIEFSRVALDGRVTLVVDPLAPPVRTWWAPLAVDSLDAAVSELARREGVGSERIGDWIGVEGGSDLEDPGIAGIHRGRAPLAIRAAIADWLGEQPLDAVLWTALPARGPDGRFERPAVEALLAHLASLEGAARARAEQYIRRAPAPLRTPNRLRIEAELGWTCDTGSRPGPREERLAIREIDDSGFSTQVGETEWLFATPELPVADVRASQAYYRDVLGFRIAWLYEESYGAVYNGKTEIFLRREAGEIGRVTVFVRVANADRVLEVLRGRGAKIVEEIASQPWGMREFSVEELNGHRFRIGHSAGPIRPSASSPVPQVKG